MKKFINQLRGFFPTSGIITIIFLCTLLTGAMAQAAVLKGTVYDRVLQKPVEFATIYCLETKSTSYTGKKGTYILKLPRNGEFTIIVQSPGLRTLQRKLTVKGTIIRNFHLNGFTARLRTITVIGRRDIQKVSRYTMSVKDLKEVPASFGDAVSALTALPGVNRTNGFFGPLVIRGQPVDQNNYFIDGIPIFSPLHFGGLHSVINNNLMNEIDLYASAAPARFGSVISAAISINTIDNVKEFGGYADVGLISAAALIQVPIFREKDGGLALPNPVSTRPRKDTENAGYIIASGRYGYLSLFVPLFYELVTGDELAIVPNYWDYQFKARYDFNKRHSVKMLLIGNKDYFVFNEKGQVDPDKGDDPLFQGFKFKTDTLANSQGLYYIYKPSNRMSNTLMGYSALLSYYSYFNLPEEGVADVWKDINITSKPYIFGIKDRIYLEIIEKHLEFFIGPEFTYYYFTANGKTILQVVQNVVFNVGDTDQFQSVYLDERVINRKVGGYSELKWTWKGLKVSPGFRTEYLDRSGEVTTDPRGMISYEFPTKTTVSLAGGKYSYFIQTNPNVFQYFPNVTKIGKGLKPEKAIHRVVGIEQEIGLYTLKLEGFYNHFYDLTTSYPHLEADGTYLEGLSSGKLKTYGFEVMIKKDILGEQNGLFGWINYTYAHSRYKSGLPTEDGYAGQADNIAGDPYGDRWIDSDYDQEHTLKLVMGYRHGRHTFSSKFQVYTSIPYSPIVGDYYDENYNIYTGGNRYIPVMGEPNSERFEPDHRLDLRYSYKRRYRWGYISWYIEVINVYNHRSKNQLKWDYRKPYSADNPRIQKPDDSLGIIPNFGVEVKF